MTYRRRIDKEIALYAMLSRVNATDMGEAIYRRSDVLDSKVSGLLTHISIMIGILSLLLAQIGNLQNYDTFTYAITLEIILYLIFSIGCLRALFVVSPGSIPGDDPNPVDRIVIFLRRRRRIYLASLNGTIFVTMAFLSTLAERVFLHHLL